MTAYNKILWSIVSDAFWRSINVIPVNKPLSNSFKSYLLGKTDTDLLIDLVQILIGKYITYVYLKAKQLFDHDLFFKWSKKF